MSKRYREQLEDVECADGAGPSAFRWRGQRYLVQQVCTHWREDAGWWRRPAGSDTGPLALSVLEIEQADLWRLEVRRDAGSTTSVVELVRHHDTWRLASVWD